MELKVRIKNVFGNKTIYPVCDKSKLLCVFKKQKTLTENDVDILKQLDYSFVIEPDQL